MVIFFFYLMKSDESGLLRKEGLEPRNKQLCPKATARKCSMMAFPQIKGWNVLVVDCLLFSQHFIFGICVFFCKQPFSVF